MDITLLIQVLLVATAIVIAFWKGRWRLIASGLKQGIKTFQSLWLRVLLGFALGGMVQVLIPRELVAEWLGPASGLKGILIGTFIGVFMTGGPYVRMPVIASIYASGAAAGPVIALLIATPLIGLHSLIAWQIPFFGFKIPLVRYIICLLITPIAAFVGAAIFQLLNPV